MKVLVVGAGGREHALVHALVRASSVDEVLCAPGNPGIAQDARLLEAGVEDTAGLVRAARDEAVDLVVVGPEVPLVAGLVDALDEAGIAAFGPTAAAAQLEGSKAYAKEVMAQAGVPTAAYRRVRSLAEGLDALPDGPVVVKADGLAAGKGVFVAASRADGEAALREIFEAQAFGETEAIVEEHLEGPELSLLALCDGARAVPLASARDFKRIGEGDTGPNTGGMGSFSPVPGFGEGAAAALCQRIHQPVVDTLAERGTPFHGVLYAGLMLTADGPKVLEFNVRFGDPETQAVLPRLRSDLGALLLAATRTGGLRDAALDWDDRAAVCLVLASRGYPASSSKGDVIRGLDLVDADAAVTHAGTALDGAGETVTAGGRVLNVTALGDDVAAARHAAYAAAAGVRFEGLQLRDDIAAGV